MGQWVQLGGIGRHYILLTAAFEQLPVFNVEDFATLILTCQQKADMIFG